MKKFISNCTDVDITTSSTEATIIQTRHRIPEIPLKEGQILVLQVPIPEPLRIVEPSEATTKKMHAEVEYSPMWLVLYEDLIQYDKIAIGVEYPVLVENRYIMNPSPIPRYDLEKLHQSEGLYLFGAGREKKIYAIPPYTDVVPLVFDDVPFRKEDFTGKKCRLCGAEGVYLDEVFNDQTGERYYECSDTGYCNGRR